MLKCLAKKSEPRLMLSSCLNFCQNEPHHAYNHHAYKKKNMYAVRYGWTDGTDFIIGPFQVQPGPNKKTSKGQVIPGVTK